MHPVFPLNGFNFLFEENEIVMLQAVYVKRYSKKAMTNAVCYSPD